MQGFRVVGLTLAYQTVHLLLTETIFTYERERERDSRHSIIVFSKKSTASINTYNINFVRLCKFDEITR